MRKLLAGAIILALPQLECCRSFSHRADCCTGGEEPDSARHSAGAGGKSGDAGGSPDDVVTSPVTGGEGNPGDGGRLGAGGPANNQHDAGATHDAGGAGAAHDAGGASTTSSGAALGGAAGAPEEPSPAPYCVTDSDGHPYIALTAAADASLAFIPPRVPFVAFITQPATSIVALSWSYTPKQSGVSFTRWACFDTVPNPVRTAAGNGTDGQLQVYSSSRLGELFVRQGTTRGYDDWKRLETPAQARVRDIAVLDSSSPALYVATDRGIFRRWRVQDESKVLDAAWLEVVSTPAMRLTVVELGDGRHSIHFIDSAGQISRAMQRKTDAEFGFDGDQEVDAQEFLDVASATSANDRPQVFAISDTGELLHQTATSSDEWGSWQSVIASGELPKLSSLSAGSIVGGTPVLLGVGPYGLPYMSFDGGLSWTTTFTE